MDLNATREEFENLDYFNPTIDFTSVVIIPTKDLHDSGYRCMKYALINKGEVVGCIGGACDVIHLNGIGGYGKYGTYNYASNSNITKRIAWCIDCLPNGLIRLFCDHKLDTDNIICSDFSLYIK